MNFYAIRRWSRSATWPALCACVVFVQQAALAATIKVTTASDSGFGSLRAAITAANSTAADDLIVFEIPSGFDRTIDLASELPRLTSNMSIINSGATVTIARSFRLRTPGFWIFTIAPGNTVIMEGLTITRGAGGISNRGSTLSLRNCTLHQNELVTTDTTALGAAIDNFALPGDPAARLTLRNCTLTENSLTGDNHQGSGGGALRNYAGENATASATLDDCLLRKNSTYKRFSVGPPGGAIANIAFGVATVSLTRCTVEQNYADPTWLAGGIYNSPQGANGRAVLNIKDSTVRNNTADSGGALYNIASYPENRANAVVTLENCTLSGNQALPSGGAAGGGAISNGGVLTLTNCTLDGNMAVGEGAGSGGGAIFSFGGSTTLTNCTFRNNNSDRAASIFNGTLGTISTANTIYDREAGSDVHFINEGTFISRGHNICDDSAGGPFSIWPGGLLNATGDRRFTNPGLLALANNGGPTQTCALEQNSVAINAGNDAIAPPTDQRGYARFGVSDIGAYERGL